MKGEQLCLFCNGTGIDEENSFFGEGPSEYSMGEPPYFEPCLCQFVPLADWEIELLREAFPDADQ